MAQENLPEPTLSRIRPTSSYWRAVDHHFRHQIKSWARHFGLTAADASEVTTNVIGRTYQSCAQGKIQPPSTPHEGEATEAAPKRTLRGALFFRTKKASYKWMHHRTRQRQVEEKVATVRHEVALQSLRESDGLDLEALRPYLSPEVYRVAELLLAGHSFSEIAKLENCCSKTVSARHQKFLRVASEHYKYDGR